MPTILRLTKDLPYPIEIISIDCEENYNINKKRPIFAYKYSKVNDVLIKDEDDLSKTIVKKQKVEMVNTFDSPVNGKILKINIKKGLKIEEFDPYVSIVEVDEGCLHEIVYAGLCAVCGRNVDEDDEEELPDSEKNSMFNQQSSRKNDFINRDKDTSKATLSYSNQNIKVSRSEVNRINREHMEKLRKNEKLILVVDLDQTVIHCGIDTSISDWIKKEKPKDVFKFCLEENIKPWLQKQSVFIRQQYMNKSTISKNWYYVKTRPYLKEFFAAIKNQYELHIYTMATRAYAEEIAKIIDPDGTLFQNRILSRDENQSLTSKSLDKVFPVEQDLVLIIDDRGDVWDWSPNLIKVIPYNYFQGIGDINNLQLPKQNLSEIPENVDKKTHEEKDDQLSKLTNQLLDVHANFYSKENKLELTGDSKKDVRDILRNKRTVLFQGCRFKYEKMTKDLQKQIEQFGGRITPTEKDATHIIIDTGEFAEYKKETNKVHAGLAWFYKCCENWEVDEKYVVNRIKQSFSALKEIENRTEEEEYEPTTESKALFKDGMSWLDDEEEEDEDNEDISEGLSSDSDSDSDLEKELELELK
ncbi:hypothetical protein QEN19_003626 [Hanseniaspora menglaensis]